MKYITTALSVFVALTCLSAQTINITGTVSSCSGDPISGAIVNLVSEDIQEEVTSTTDAEGSYTIDYTVPVGVGDAALFQGPQYSLMNRELKLVLTLTASVSVEFRDLSGKLIQDINFSTLDNGKHLLALPELKDAGLYFMTLNIGNTKYYHRVLFSSTGFLTQLQSNVSGLTQNNNMLSKQSALAETLEISATGFTTQIAAIDNLESTIDVVLLTTAEFEEGDGECPAPVVNDGPEFKIVHFAVGSADATLFIFPTGKTMIFDSGTEDMGKNQIVPFLERHGIDHLDYYAETHRHPDHSDGRIPLEDAGMINSNTDVWNAEGKKLSKYEYEDEFELEGTSWFVYNISDSDLYEAAEENEKSFSMRIEYNGFVYTGTGDEGSFSQDRFLNEHPDLVEAHVRYTAHHGYDAPNTDFLKATNPYLVTISNQSANVSKWEDATSGNSRETEVVVTGDVGHVIIRASGGGEGEWSYEFCAQTKSCIMDYIP
jgi:beta-lactamase superfamily II metal-dependent hydrolase